MAPWFMAMISGKRRVVTETFTSSQTWVCPLGVSRINTLTGKGQDGSYDSQPGATAVLINVRYNATGSGVNSGPLTWSNVDGLLNNYVTQLGSGGTFSYLRIITDAYADGSFTNTEGTQTLAEVVPGSAGKITTGAWATSGAITASGDGGASYNYYLAGAPGAATTGFGYTFAGGAASTAATPVPVDNVSVTGGTSYALSIPAGGSITISYFR